MNMHLPGNEHLELLKTEQVNPLTDALDLLPTVEMVKTMNQLDRDVPEKVGAEAESIAQAVDLVVKRFRSGGRLIYVGAGTSARLGFMDAAECPPTFGVPADQITCIMAGGRNAVFQPAEGVEDDEGQAGRDLQEFGLRPADIVLAIASSGRTPYSIGALRYAAQIGAGRISLSCNKKARLSQYAEVAIEVDSGAEAIMGSTRLKGGTAQKLVLNMISTLAMVQTGCVYKNLMVNVSGVNTKLNSRVLRIFAEATGNQDPECARKRLTDAHGALKVAIFMELAGLGPELARRLLAENGGCLRPALTDAAQYQ